MVASCQRCAKPLIHPGASANLCKECSDIVVLANRSIVELKKKALTTSEPFEKNRLLNEIKKAEQRRDKAI